MSTPTSGPGSDKTRIIVGREEEAFAYDDKGAVRVNRKPKLIPVPTPAGQSRPPPLGPLPPRFVGPVDQAALLSVSQLTLSRELTMATPQIGRLIVCYHPARRRMVLTPLQWRVLQCFEGGRTVPAALKHLIQNSGCIPLNEFYELILQACDHGILQTPGHPVPPPTTPIPWKFTAPGTVLRPLGMMLLATCVILLIVRPLEAPSHLLWWLPGWALLCVAASAGSLLVGGVLHAGEGLLHRPRFHRRSVLPRLVIDHDELPLEGTETELALAQLIPFVALAILTSIFAPDLTLPMICGLLWNLAPFGKLPGLRLLRALRYAPRLSTSQDFRFKPNQTLTRRIRVHLEANELRLLALRAGYAVPWSLLVILTVLVTSGVDLEKIWRAALSHNLPTLILLSLPVLLAAVGIGALVVGGILARERWRARRAEAEPARSDTPTQVPVLISPEDIVRFFGETYPFQFLPIKHRQLLAPRIRQTLFQPGETLIPAGDKRRRFYLLYSGSVRVDATGHKKQNLTLGPGSILGETVLLHGGEQPTNIIALEAGLLLSFNHEAYDEVVAPVIPRHKIEDAVQTISFLRQIALSRRWSVQMLDSFARRAVVHQFSFGTIVLEAGQDNLWFYVLQEGELRVMKEGRRVGRIQPGDFFGEISLLQNSPTTAQVVGHHPGRYIAMPKQDFLNFITQNPTVALQFESLASQRLGRPLFPL